MQPVAWALKYEIECQCTKQTILTNTTEEQMIIIIGELIVRMTITTMKMTNQKLELRTPMIRTCKIKVQAWELFNVNFDIFRCLGEKIVEEVRCGHDNPPCSGGLYDTPGNFYKI